MSGRRRLFVISLLLGAWPASAQDAVEDREARSWGLRAPLEASASQRILQDLALDETRRALVEVLERNPGVAAAEARARAERHRLPQARALPDPMARLGAFVLPPETRVGPQRLSVGVSQELPWPGKLALEEEAALYDALAFEAAVDEERLTVLEEARRSLYEIAFLERTREITEEFRTHLLQHEEISRARYSTGVGLGQGVVKLQAAINRGESDLLALESRRAAEVARFNALRDRPAATPLVAPTLHHAREVLPEIGELVAAALFFRPGLAAADARIAAADARVRRAELERRPDLRVGLSYTVVDPREDELARLQPPADDGDDILALEGGIVLPVRRARRSAAIEEGVDRRRAAHEEKRAVAAAVESAIGDLTYRVPLGWRRLRLVEDLLVVQAEEALAAAQAAYVGGSLNALDLLDAEHVLFEARTALARARADYLIDLARLEGALGASLVSITRRERSEP